MYSTKTLYIFIYLLQRKLDQGNIKGGRARCRKQNAQQGTTLSNHCSQTKEKSSSLECGSSLGCGYKASAPLMGPPKGKRETKLTLDSGLGGPAVFISFTCYMPAQLVVAHSDVRMAFGVGGWEVLLPIEQRAAAERTETQPRGRPSSSQCLSLQLGVLFQPPKAHLVLRETYYARTCRGALPCA